MSFATLLFVALLYLLSPIDARPSVSLRETKPDPRLAGRPAVAPSGLFPVRKAVVPPRRVASGGAAVAADAPFASFGKSRTLCTPSRVFSTLHCACHVLRRYGKLSVRQKASCAHLVAKSGVDTTAGKPCESWTEHTSVNLVRVQMGARAVVEDCKRRSVVVVRQGGPGLQHLQNYIDFVNDLSKILNNIFGPSQNARRVVVVEKKGAVRGRVERLIRYNNLQEE